MKKIHVLGGGTLSYVRSHLALAAPAFGTTAKEIAKICEENETLETVLHLTQMAGGNSSLRTVEDVAKLLEELKNDADTKIIFMNVAMCDFAGKIGEVKPDKYSKRLNSKSNYYMELQPAPKLISTIREKRKDIFLVGFKQTCGDTEEEQYIKGLNLVKASSCNLVLANDVETKLNMVITPEEAKYHVTTNRQEALKGLVDMTFLRSHLTFTRSTVVEGKAIPWSSTLVYDSLRQVVNYCIKKGAYKPFRGVTAGHFAVKLTDNMFLTSIRKTDFNKLPEVGLVKVVTDGPDNVIAYGFKPSVGGQSQRIVFNAHESYDCIVHFHCPIKPDSKIKQVSQRSYECGSHNCGKNTSDNLMQVDKDILAVYLMEHGPNIVFKHTVAPEKVIKVIEENFDLEEKTGGHVSLSTKLNTPNTLDTLVALTNE